MRSNIRSLLWFLLPVSLIFGEYHTTIHGFPLYPFELIILAQFAANVRRVSWSSIRKVFASLPKMVTWGVVFFLVALVPAFLVAPDHMAALGVIKSWIVFPLIAIALFVLSEESSEPLEYGIILHACLQTLVGFFLLQLQPEHRLQGLFDSANFYAAVVVPASFIAFHRIRREKWQVAVVVLLVVGLLLSQSLGGFLGMVGGLLYLGGTARTKTIRSITAFAGVGILLIGGVLGYIRFYHQTGTSLESRQQIWKVATVLISEHPVTGVGIKGFHHAYEQEVGRVIGVPVEWSVPEPHNLYLGWWLNYGIAGLAALIAIVWGVICLPHRGAAAALIAILVHGLVDTPFLKLELAVLFWLYCALLLGARHGKR